MTHVSRDHSACRAHFFPRSADLMLDGDLRACGQHQLRPSPFHISQVLGTYARFARLHKDEMACARHL